MRCEKIIYRNIVQINQFFKCHKFNNYLIILMISFSKFNFYKIWITIICHVRERIYYDNGNLILESSKHCISIVDCFNKKLSLVFIFL